MICLFIFSISSWFGLRRLYLSEKLHFFYVVHFIYIQFLVIVSWDLCISVVSVVTSHFYFLFYWFESSIFFLMKRRKFFSFLFIFSKNQVLVSLLFAIVSFVSIILFCILSSISMEHFVGLLSYCYFIYPNSS